MFGTSTGASTGSTLGRSASFSFSQPPATRPFSGTMGAFTFGGATGASTSTASAAAPAPAPATGGFSFGASAPVAQTAGGLFGGSTAQKPAQTGALFGGGATQQPAQSGGLFGGSLNAATQQQQATASPFSRFGYFQKQRFNDLPEDAKKLVEELDKHISSQLQIKDELKTKDFGADIRKCAAEWQELDSALTSLSATLETDSSQARDVADRVERDRSDQATLYAIATNAREGRSDGAGFIQWLQAYFANLAEEFKARITRYRNGMETIEKHLAGLERRDIVTPGAISDTIQAQHTSFMALAAEVAALHAQVETLKRDFARWYQQTNRSYRDPFASMSSLAGSVGP